MRREPSAAVRTQRALNLLLGTRLTAQEKKDLVALLRAL